MRRRVLITVALMAIVAVACTQQPPPTTEPPTLPPYERDDLAAIFDPLLEPLGYAVTTASLIDRTTEEADPSGDHLAVRVAPVSEISMDRIATDFSTLVPVFLPMVFDRWPELATFDVSQDPFGSAADPRPPLTTIDLTRRAAAGVDWSSLDLAGIIDLNDRQGMSVWARREVRETATWRSAAGP